MTIGQFDLYPIQKDTMKLEKLLSSEMASDPEERKTQDVEKTNNGCYHVKGFMNAHF